MKNFIRTLLLFIAKSMQALSIVDDASFIDPVRCIDTRIVLPCRNTITFTHLPEIFEEVRLKLMEELRLAYYVALTTDGWTSIKNTGYLTVTVHNINGFEGSFYGI